MIYSEWNNEMVDYDIVRKYELKYFENLQKFEADLRKYTERFVEEYLKKRDGGESYRLVAKIMMIGQPSRDGYGMLKRAGNTA